ncbi:hypothetical protein [Frankia sp. EI5c]|uniref:hypothetical protein n=1 Tax=Frankia sp. EI5c TaxID=683316 RepID=UPI001F5B2B93|nr:hypothetical protein [Frankia sp. EI5c]
MQAEYYSSLDGEPANRQAALTFAPEAVRRLSSIPGVLHLAASVIADHHEADADADPRLLLEGERLVRQAIALSNGTYPRYHATHARIATLRGAYGAARASIGRAIEEEDSSGAEYALRIGDYQLIRARILHAQQAETLRAGQSEATAELRRIRAQILEIMGLLAAVIAFITTAANITAGQPPGPAAGLLTTAGGVTLLVFWGSWILGDVPEAARHARCLSVPLAGGEEVLVCSDGFARLVEPFGLVDGYAALLRAVRGGAGAAGDLVERKNHRRHRSDPAPTVAAWRFI